MAGGVLSTAAAPLSVRRRPAAARLVPTSTGCSRGAEACRFGHVTRAARCLLACERWQETPRSWSSMSAAAGVRAGPPGWAKLRAGLRARRPRGASMARRSTGACPACSGHSVQPRRAVWEGLQSQGGLPRARWRTEYTMTTSSRSGRRQRACAACCSTAGRSPPFQQCLLPRCSRCNRYPLPGAGAGRLASPALPTPTTRASARRPRSPAAGPRGETRVGNVLSRLCSAA